MGNATGFVVVVVAVTAAAGAVVIVVALRQLFFVVNMDIVIDLFMSSKSKQFYTYIWSTWNLIYMQIDYVFFFVMEKYKKYIINSVKCNQFETQKKLREKRNIKS